jgi:hypothetical protein
MSHPSSELLIGFQWTALCCVLEERTRVRTYVYVQIFLSAIFISSDLGGHEFKLGSEVGRALCFNYKLHNFVRACSNCVAW